MAYKRISPMPIIEGGTNATSFATTDGVVYYDGTKLNVTSAGTSTQLLTSNGSGVAPSFQTAGSPSISIIGVGVGTTSGSLGINQTAGIRWFGCPARTAQATSAAAEAILSKAGTASNLYVYVSNNASTIDTTVTLNKNGSHTALVLTIPAGTTGNFSNTVNSVAFSQTDLIQFECSQSTTGNVLGAIAITFG